METLNKVPDSKAIVRFQDCDPFNHLNNSKYVDYFLNAREDHLIANYGLNIYQIARSEGLGWVVASSQIAYMKPANLMEVVMIESQLIEYNEKNVLVEMRMWDHKRDHLKSFMWSRFAHFNLRTNRSEKHNVEYMRLFEKVVLPLNEKTFEERQAALFLQAKTTPAG